MQFEWIEGDPIMGKASGQTSELGDLRIACEAALRAIESFAKGAFTLELLGVKLIRAFDSNVIIVAVSAKRPEGATRLLGCTLAERTRSTVPSLRSFTRRTVFSATSSHTR